MMMVTRASDLHDPLGLAVVARIARRLIDRAQLGRRLRARFVEPALPEPRDQLGRADTRALLELAPHHLQLAPRVVVEPLRAIAPRLDIALSRRELVRALFE